MSFVIAVQRFLSVALSDDAGNPVDAFLMKPTTRTRALLANFGLVFRGYDTGLTLYFRTNPAVTPPLVTPIADRVRFSFAMFPAGPAPYAGLSSDQGSHILLDNLDEAGAIQQGGSLTAGAAVDVAEHVFAGPNRYPFAVDLSGGTPANAEALDRFSNAVVAQTPIEDLAAEPPVAPPPGAASLATAIDIPKQGPAALRLRTPAPGTLDRLIYADDDIVAGNPAGIIDLYWQGPQDAVPATTGLTYTAVLARQ